VLGDPVTSEIRLRHPDGRVTRHRLGDRGEVALRSLPSGRYRVEIPSAALAASWPIRLTRDEDVEVDVVSRADVGIVVGGAAVLALVLLAAGRLRPRRRAAR
jgi:hypothetical protein